MMAAQKLKYKEEEMLGELRKKIKESLISVLPVTILVILLYFTPLLSLTSRELVIFIISAVFLIVGIGLFNLGADMAMSPIGEQIGSSLIKTKKIWLALLVCFVMGVLITVAEPDLSVLAQQVKDVMNNNTTLLIVTVGLGVGIFLMLAVIKIIYKKDLSLLLMLFYFLMFAVACLVVNSGNGAFLAMAFDSGGVTTGPITVPFIMALGIGIAQTIGGRDSKENSFGLIALCSVGPILVVLLLSLSFSGSISFNDFSQYEIFENSSEIVKVVLSSLKEVSLALGLIVAFFLVIELIFIKLPKQKLVQIFVGILYTLIGLVMFLSSVTIGFMPVGFKIGVMLAETSPVWIIVIGFILGMVVVLAEPAVHVLTKQVEDVTTGGVSKRAMLIALCLGVGISIGLSMIRITFNFSILYYIIPGYFISLALSFFVPKVYTAIAFDSGGVASGPLTSSFILPLAIGACLTLQGNSKILEDAFGIVAMVAMTPLITIQLLGFKSVMTDKAREKIRMKKIIDADDEQIIYFN